VARFAARRPYDDNHSASQESHGDDARFAIIAAIVGAIQRRPGKDFGRIGEIEPAFAQGPVALGGIEGDFHSYIICIYEKDRPRKMIEVFLTAPRSAPATTNRRLALRPPPGAS
jgi:hypothetical protein